MLGLAGQKDGVLGYLIQKSIREMPSLLKGENRPSDILLNDADFRPSVPVVVRLTAIAKAAQALLTARA